jgi:hypothetical protein
LAPPYGGGTLRANPRDARSGPIRRCVRPQLLEPVNTSITGGFFGLGLFIIIDDD